ncbi:COP9 signalosome complex subunit 3, partial [Coemansia sp. RSA 2703]
MAIFGSSSPYEKILSVSEKMSASVAAAVRSWQTPIREFNEDIFANALKRANPQQNPLAYVQITIDMMVLSLNSMQVEMTKQALTALCSGAVQMVQVARVNELIDRLARALGHMATSKNDIPAVCELVVDIVDVMNAQMAAQIQDDPQGTGFVKQTLGSTKGIRLTPLHVECLRLCILARRRVLHERVARTILDVEFASFGQQSGETRAKAFMQYCYYAGMIYAALADDVSLRKAQKQWMLTFAIPGKFASYIQLEAFKKLTLVNLMLDGKPVKLPSFFAPTHVKAIEGPATSYSNIADAFSGTKSMARALSRVKEKQGLLANDDNVGLADLLVQRMPAQFIKRMGDVYSSMRLGTLAKAIGFDAHPLASHISNIDELATTLAQFIESMNDDSVTVVEQDGTPTSANSIVRFSPACATLSSVPNAPVFMDRERIAIEQQ